MKKYQIFVAVLIVLFAVSAHAIDISAYKIIREKLPCEKGVAEKWENYIQFRDSAEKIKLARTLKRDTGKYIMGKTDQGFDEKTLRVTELGKPGLMLISWLTYARTDAGYEYSGYVVLKSRGGNYVELLRHNVDNYWYQGGCTSYKQKLYVSYDEKPRILKFTLYRHDRKCPTPENPKTYFTKKDTRSIWCYRFDGSSLKFIGGEELDRRRHTPLGEMKTDSYDGLYGVYKELR
jgi:hypothetical protein